MGACETTKWSMWAKNSFWLATSGAHAMATTRVTAALAAMLPTSRLDPRMTTHIATRKSTPLTLAVSPSGAPNRKPWKI